MTDPPANDRSHADRHPPATEPPLSPPSPSSPPSIRTATNPFSTRYVRPGAIRYRFPPSTEGPSGHELAESSIVERLRRARFGQIIGAHGSGKSTLLQTLMPILKEEFLDVIAIQTRTSDSRGVLSRLRHGIDTNRAAGSARDRLVRGGLLVIDGAEQLSWTTRLRLVRQARATDQSLLVTSHSPLAGFTTLHETVVTETLLKQLASDLLQGTPENWSRPISDELDRRGLPADQNVRELWFQLYDLFESHRESGGGDPPHRPM